MGNLGSISNMLKHIGAKSTITSDPAAIESAEKIILPGVGHFDKAMYNLKQLELVDVLRKKVLKDCVPVMGICLGMQLLCTSSEEGGMDGLGFIDASVKRFSFSKDNGLKIPHMGWNLVKVEKLSPLMAGTRQDSRFYFVHSYHAVCNDPKDVLSSTQYGYRFTSSVERNNIIGVQFHPEKSHSFGMQLLKNFIEKY
jgi:glutamine amidotransferase